MVGGEEPRERQGRERIRMKVIQVERVKNQKEQDVKKKREVQLRRQKYLVSGKRPMMTERVGEAPHQASWYSPSGTSGTSPLSCNTTTTPNLAYLLPSSTGPLPNKLDPAPAPSQISGHRYTAPCPLEKERPVAVHPTLA